jgi:hypothetical protein
MDCARWLIRTALIALLGVALGGTVRAQEPGTEIQPGMQTPPGMQAQPGPPVVGSDPAETPRKWIDNLPYRPIPPLGNSPVLPSGPGYYSALDVLTGHYRADAPTSAFPPYALMRNSFYDADFRYLDDPNYVSEDFFDRFHNVHLGDNWLFNTGGQADWRYMHQENSRLSGKTDDFDLLRARTYADFWYKDMFRFYAEIITSGTYNQDLKPLKTDVNSIDFLNLFVGFKIAEFDDHPAYLRVGRQELLFGSERLVTPLEWANTRQTFQGVHGLWSNDKWDVDLFWVQYVTPNPTGWSQADPNQNFSGTWFTYHPDKKSSLDMYWLWLDDRDTSKTLGIVQDPTSVHTFGTRYTGNKDDFLWDFEPMIQVGERGSQSILAGSATAGLGYALPEAPLKPTFWAYYDWASGSQHPGEGNYNTFNQLYGFGHYYLGFMDLIARENIRDFNIQTYVYPTNWISLNIQYHILSLDSSRDALYGASGTPLRVSPKGTAGKDVGDELTFILNVHLDQHSDILFGWSELFAGEFIRKTTTTATGKFSPEMLYVMYNFRW